MEGEDDWSVSLGNPLHRTVDSSMRSLHIMLLQVQKKGQAQRKMQKHLIQSKHIMEFSFKAQTDAATATE